MASMEELEARISALEERLNMETGLQASRDRDVGDVAQTLRAQQLTIQALHITQSQHNQKLDQHTDMLRGHGQALTSAHSKLDQIIGLLGTLIDQEKGQE